MKTSGIVFLIIIIIAVIGFTPGEDRNNANPTAIQKLSGKRILPDVMNNINVVEHGGNRPRQATICLDSFPLFTGYPMHISGQSVEGGIACNMDADPELEIVYGIGFTVQAWNLDGTAVPGWPKTVSSYAVEGAPAFGDIDGDGQGEIVVTNHGLTSGGFIYAFKQDGSAVPGFPINHGYTSRTPVLADLNGDGAMEIIVNKRLYPVGEVWVYKGNGTVYPGWPKAIGHVPASSAAVGDLTGDGIPEIVAESYTALYAWEANGDTLPGFPFFMPNGAVNSYSSPVLADLDGDGFKEIVFGTHILGGGGIVFVLKRDGSQLSGWPLSTGQWIYGPPAVGYIDADTLLDIAVGDQVLSGVPADYLYAWNRNGIALQGFPIGPLNAINNQVALGDLDNDNQMELMIDDNTTLGIYLAYNHDGTALSGWPITLTGTTFFNMPCLTDVNHDGILDIVGAAKEGSTSPFTNVYLWNTGISYNGNKMTIPVWQYNNQHDGVYGRPAIVDVNRSDEVTTGFHLLQNYPNPFNPSTTITFSLEENGHTSLRVFDLLGREVTTLVNEVKPAGTYEVRWDATRFGTGVYYYRLSVSGITTTKKMLMMK
jgi:hypothetical protein